MTHTIRHAVRLDRGSKMWVLAGALAALAVGSPLDGTRHADPVTTVASVVLSGATFEVKMGACVRVVCRRHKSFLCMQFADHARLHDVKLRVQPSSHTSS
jgi:hypothetical protein